MLQFTDREEVSQLRRVLSSSKHESSTYFKLSGKSGSGKTELIKKAVDTLVRSDMLYIYIDITPDEFQSTSFFPTLLDTIYMPLSHNYQSITNIPEELALSKYIKKIFKAHTGFEKFFNALTVSAAALPKVGGPLSLIMDKWLMDKSNSLDSLLFIYFKYVIKKTRINLVVDNYQFLPVSIKKVLETEINQFNFGFTFVVIERVTDKPTYEPLFCRAFRQEHLNLEYMSYEQCKLVIEKQKLDISDSQMEKIWQVTKGNLKDIEIILNEVRINPGYNIISNKVAIQNLDSIERSILLIAAMFPAGMKEDLVIQFIRNILKENEESKIETAIINLVNLGYIYLNSNTHDTIKPTHETVINHIKETIDTYDFVEFSSLLSNSLEELVEYYHGTKDYTYLLHCWVGVNSVETLRKKSGFVQELILIKFKENSYYYIDTIAVSIMDVIIYLPETCIEKILISFQRVSDFRNGINILNNIRNSDKNLYDKFRIYYVKFLIQTYEFEDALKELEQIPDSSLKLLCQTNVLQHLGRNSEVEKLLSTKLLTCNQDENYFIILRNTAHFFEYGKAKSNLLRALSFFETKKYTTFATATVQNNLAVINIWHKNYEEAEQYLNLAISTLEQLNSNEVFEPYCNKSVLYLMQKNNLKALEYAQKALESCPRTLTLDIIMLHINIVIIELCNQKCSVEAAYESINALQAKYSLIEDPWYEFQLLYNQRQLSLLLEKDCLAFAPIHNRYILEYTDNKTKFYILEYFNIGNNQVSFCLGLSPNWRY